VVLVWSKPNLPSSPHPSPPHPFTSSPDHLPSPPHPFTPSPSHRVTSSPFTPHHSLLTQHPSPLTPHHSLASPPTGTKNSTPPGRLTEDFSHSRSIRMERSVWCR